MRVSVLGLGHMGAAIAERLERSGHDLSVWNRTAQATRPFADRGVTVLDAPADAWSHADLVVTMLSDSAAVEEVATALLSAPAAGVYMDMSTIGADASARVAVLAAAAGVEYLRGPVTGNPAVVAAGNLGIIVSGPRAAFDDLQGVLADIGPNLFWVGTGEQARIVKLAVNLMLGGTAQLLAEAITLAETYDIDRREFLEVVGGSAIGSNFVRYKTDALVADDFTSTFTASLLLKDIELALAAGTATGVPLPATALVRDLTEDAVRRGMGDSDFTALLPRLRSAAGLED